MLTILVWIAAFAITITIHEAAHAWMADRLGDPTARVAGRLSLNPINQIRKLFLRVWNYLVELKIVQ